jgi:hypothetical protein
MTPPQIMDDAPAIMVTDQKITRADIDRILAEDNGASALIVLMRDGRVDPDMAIDAITRVQNQPTASAKRAIVAFIERIFR